MFCRDGSICSFLVPAQAMKVYLRAKTDYISIHQDYCLLWKLICKSILPVPPEGIFLVPARKIRKNRLRGGADREAYRNCCDRPPCFPGFEPPSPENPFRPRTKVRL